MILSWANQMAIGRRQFISALGGTAVAWPLAARAQQSNPMRRVGVLPVGYLQNDSEGQARVTAFLETLQQLGWSEGRNISVDIRWSRNEVDQVRSEATELVRSAPDAIMVSSNAALGILQQLDKNISTVFVQVSDPVGSGFVSSLSRPNGNITGFQNFEPAIGGKWLGLLKEAAPAVARAAVLVHPDTAAHFEFLRAAEAVAPSLGIEVSEISAEDGNQTERGIVAFANRPDGGLIVLPHPVNINIRGLLVDLTARLRLPAIYSFRYFASSGGLMSYGFDQIEQWRGAAGYVDRILRGTKPVDLPVQAPTKYELVINMKTGRTLGLTIPQSLLATADEVIE
jgi:putative tryptophan/tyrosine transport system substrate-binding protein